MCVVCVFLSGMMLGGGCGRELAHWVIHGRPEKDMYGYDIRYINAQRVITVITGSVTGMVPLYKAEHGFELPLGILSKGCANQNNDEGLMKSERL